MARAKIIPIEQASQPAYFAYFDPVTEHLLAVTCGPHHVFTHYAKLTKDQFTDINSCKVSFDECIIDRYVNATGITEHRLITKQIADEFAFKSIEWVSAPVTVNTEFVVKWNKKLKQWTFVITPAGRSVLQGALYDSTIVFFITLETDFDFLLRTFYLRIHDLLKFGEITYSFDSTIEDDINKLSITTRTFFQQYGLEIHD